MEPSVKDDQNFWNFIFTVLFLIQFATAATILEFQGLTPISIPILDLVLIALAVFRMIRLFVYDKIFQFFRDPFLNIEERLGADGELIVVRAVPPSGPRRTISHLLACPWCFGVWAALAITFFYFLTPFAWWPILMLAVSGLASFVQVLSNMIGWRAEHYKKQVRG